MLDVLVGLSVGIEGRNRTLLPSIHVLFPTFQFCQPAGYSNGLTAGLVNFDVGVKIISYILTDDAEWQPKRLIKLSRS